MTSLSQRVIFGGSLLLVMCSSEPATVSAQAPAAAPQYVGPGSCASSSCHGSVEPKLETRVLQNEYSIWVVKDRHAGAFEALTNPVSQRMAKILKLPASADASPKCLGCHALAVPPAQQARSFTPRDGVSCESCHGPASAWLGPHTTRGWTHQQSVQAGMFDTKDLVRRAEKCLSCHLGTPENFVDHEMIAGGHPDLYFELDAFSAVMPAHWREPIKEDPWREVRAWAVGQAVQLREGLRQVARRAESGPWPEFAELQCYTCHHALTPPEQSWRQERGYGNRRPGEPPWNASRYAVFRSLVSAVNADAAKSLEADLARIAEDAGRADADRRALAQVAANAANAADNLARQLATARIDSAMVLRLQKRICADADYLAASGERAAEQAAMALDSLYNVYARNARPANEKEARAAIQALFEHLRNPNAFRPQTFSAQMARINSLLN